MGIRVDDAFIKNYIISLQIAERKHDTSQRLQEDSVVFISYSRHDQVPAKRIESILDELNVRYFLDEKFIKWGDDLRDKIPDHGLRESTHYLLIISENSIKSDWCQFEYGIAVGQRLKILTFLVDEGVNLPIYAKPILATSDINTVHNYFSQKIFEPRAIDKLIREILADNNAYEKLGQFIKQKKNEEGRDVWDSPDRNQIKESHRNLRMISYFEDRSSKSEVERLIRIEIDNASHSIVLHYASDEYIDSYYTIQHNKYLNAILAERKDYKGRIYYTEKKESDPIALKKKYDSGEVEYRRHWSVKDTLQGGGMLVYGWRSSLGFWKATFSRIRAILEACS